MSDIDLYTIQPDRYDELQHMRPDYVGAQEAFISFISKYLGDKKEISIVDFCSGEGKDTRLVCDRISVDSARLIDVNGDFLRIAKQKGIKAKNIVTIQSDILSADVGSHSDVVVSMFAYHHVRDADKAVYVQKVTDALKPGGILILGEIYTPNKETTLSYYDHLLDSIPKASETPDLQTFLKQTAQSEDFEFKVSRKFAHDQLIAAGFELIDSKKIWPTDGKFSEEVGTFVEMWKK